MARQTDIRQSDGHTLITTPTPRVIQSNLTADVTDRMGEKWQRVGEGSWIHVVGASSG